MAAAIRSMEALNIAHIVTFIRTDLLNFLQTGLQMHFVPMADFEETQYVEGDPFLSQPAYLDYNDLRRTMISERLRSAVWQTGDISPPRCRLSRTSPVRRERRHVHHLSRTMRAGDVHSYLNSKQGMCVCRLGSRAERASDQDHSDRCDHCRARRNRGSGGYWATNRSPVVLPLRGRNVRCRSSPNRKCPLDRPTSRRDRGHGCLGNPDSRNSRRDRRRIAADAVARGPRPCTGLRAVHSRGVAHSHERAARRDIDAWLDAVAIVLATVIFLWVGFAGDFIADSSFSVGVRSLNAVYNSLVLIALSLFIRIIATPGDRPIFVLSLRLRRVLRFSSLTLPPPTASHTTVVSP